MKTIGSILEFTLVVCLITTWGWVAQAADNKQPSRQLPVRMSWLMNKPAKSPMGQDYGKVADVVVVPRQGIGYVIIEYGGTLGIGEKLIPIPWKAVQMGDDKQVVIITVDKESLEKAPSFNPSEWPAFDEGAWDQEMMTFYSLDETDAEGKE